MLVDFLEISSQHSNGLEISEKHTLKICVCDCADIYVLLSFVLDFKGFKQE